MSGLNTGLAPAIIDRGRFYDGAGQGALFGVEFGEKLRTLLTKTADTMSYVELAVSEDGLHVSAKDPSGVVGVNIAIAPEAFDSFDVARSGYVTMWSGVMGSALDVLQHAEKDRYRIYQDGTRPIQFDIYDTAFEVDAPLQSRDEIDIDGPPAPDASEFIDEHTTRGTFENEFSIERAYDAVEGAEETRSTLELARQVNDAGWLTISTEETAPYKVRFDHWSGANGYAIYSGYHVYNAIGLAYHTKGEGANWSFTTEHDPAPLLISSENGGVTTNAIVAPRLPEEHELLYPGATDIDSRGEL